MELSASAVLVAAADGGSVPVSVLWAGAFAVVAAAAITAFGVDRQTKRTLWAAEKQLATQLAHERAMREREELRNLVDEAAARLDVLTFEVADVRGMREQIESESGSPADSEELDSYLTTALLGIREAGTLLSRLDVRLGSEHEIVQVYRKAWMCYYDYQRESRKVDGDPDPEAFANAGRLSAEFMAASHRLLRSKLGS